MVARILCLSHPKQALTVVLADAMRAGVARHGDVATVAATWDGVVEHDAVVAYGWRYWRDCFAAYRAAAKPYVFIDLAYWGRMPDRAAAQGFYKVTVNSRHPVVRLDRPGDRVARFGLTLAPWRTEGRHILVAGMSAKNAQDLGIAPASWEAGAVAALRGLTKRPIVYRPKPTWREARPLAGARYSAPGEPLQGALANCWAVVTHHSNVGVDALVAGVPIFTEEGAAKPFSMAALAQIEQPVMPDGRADFVAGLAYCQWSLSEMQGGLCWEHVRQEMFGG